MPGYHLLEHGTPLPGQDDAAGRPELGGGEVLRVCEGSAEYRVDVAFEGPTAAGWRRSL